MTKHEHVTFSRGEEVIEHAIRYLTWIQDALDELGRHDHDERVKLLLNSVAVEQRELLGSLERLLEDADQKVLGTYTQYTVEMPAEVAPPEEPLTGLGLVKWLESYNSHLQEMFAELAQKGDSQEAGEAFAGIAEQVEAHDRRLSKEYQRTEDM